MTAERQTGRYPLLIGLADQQLTLRPMTAADRDNILAFANAQPAHDLLFLPSDITQPEHVDEWIEELERGELVTILALRDGRILGYSTISRSPWSWSRHVAELRVMVSDDVRRQGVGQILTKEVFRIALDWGVEKVTARMTADQHGALNIFQRLGFRNEALLKDEVKDRDGNSHDLIVLRHGVSLFETSVLLADHP